MNKKDIERYLEMLGRRLANRGIKGEMYVVGGAAMALAFDARRVTRDVDAVFAPKLDIYQAAKEIAEEQGLPQSWLNDAVKGYLVKEDERRMMVFDRPGLRVYSASAEYLFAMKCLAARREDEDDIRFLLNLIGIKNLNEALKIVEEVYPQHRISPRTQFLLEEILG